MIDFIITSIAILNGYMELNPLWKWNRYGQIIFMIFMDCIAWITYNHLVKYGFKLGKTFMEIFFVGMCLYYGYVLMWNIMVIT